MHCSSTWVPYIWVLIHRILINGFLYMDPYTQGPYTWVLMHGGPYTWGRYPWVLINGPLYIGVLIDRVLINRVLTCT